MSLEQLWAGWRNAYIQNAVQQSNDQQACVFCNILSAQASDEELNVLWRGKKAAAILNAYPYVSGHFMVMPYRHCGEMDELDSEEGMDLLRGMTNGVKALKKAYAPQGINVGANMGLAAGAGIPGHFHIHALPRWNGDTNFMTTVAETRVIPESLPETWRRLKDAWPS